MDPNLSELINRQINNKSLVSIVIAQSLVPNVGVTPTYDGFFVPYSLIIRDVYSGMSLDIASYN